MNVFVTEKPSLLLETTELLYAFVNDVPLEDLACAGEFCIPAEAIREMFEAACVDLNKKDPALCYYFGKQQLFENSTQYTCIARHMTFNLRKPDTGSVAEGFDVLRKEWRNQMTDSWQLKSADQFRLSFMEKNNTDYVSLEAAIHEIGIAQSYAKMLLEQLAGWEICLNKLEKLMTPVSERLAPLLDPWVKRAAPLADAWRALHSRKDAESYLIRSLGLNQKKSISSLNIQLLYLNPKSAPGMAWEDCTQIFLHIGLAIPLIRERSTFDTKEFQALRLLGSETRMQMLRVLLDRPMSSRELAKALNLHLGVVTRDISNLYDAQLINVEASSRYVRYRTNLYTLQMIGKHLAELEKYPLVDLCSDLNSD